MRNNTRGHAIPALVAGALAAFAALAAGCGNRQPAPGSTPQPNANAGGPATPPAYSASAGGRPGASGPASSSDAARYQYLMQQSGRAAGQR